MINPKYTIRRQINYAIRFIAVFLLAMIIVFLVFAYYPLRLYNERYSENIILQMEQNITLSVNNIMKINDFIRFNEYVSQYAVATDLKEIISTKNAVESVMNNVIALNSDIRGISIMNYSNVNKVFSNSNNYNEYSLLNECCKLYQNSDPEKKFIIYTIGTEDGMYYYCAVKPIYKIQQYERSGQKIGAVFVLCSMTSINDRILDLKLRGKSTLSLLDDKNMVIASNKSSELGTVVELDNSYKKLPIEKFQWTIINKSVENEFASNILSVVIYVIFAWFVVVFAIFVMDRFIQRKVTKPIERLVFLLEEIGTKNIRQRIDFISDNELYFIAKAVNGTLERIENMSRDIFNTQREMYEIEEMKKQTDLMMLRMQINPHFLYNALECIRSYGIVNNINEISEIAYSLSDILRYSISGGGYVMVRKELDIVNQYLNITNIRFPNRYVVHMDIKDELQDKYIMKMILQPIVENAIKHGLEPVGRGELSIVGRNTDEYIEFIIENNGVGITPERLRHINEVLLANSGESKNTNDCIGLKNVWRRIDSYNDDRFYLAITSDNGVGCKVTLRLPNITDINNI